MAGESNKTKDSVKNLDATSEKKDSGITVKKKQRGFLSRIWNGLFNRRDDDFEKRLQRIAKEESAVVARMEKRSQSWKRMTRHLIIFSVFFEVIAVGYAIMTTRSIDLNWKMRASRVLPMFLLPALSSLVYSGLMSFSRMRDRKDQKTLERLRAERQAEVDELKEKRNFYRTQQLIQRYDTDPAAKAAAASVLASKLGADSGLKLYIGDESSLHGVSGKSSDMEHTQSNGLRNRKQSHAKSASIGSTVVEQTGEHMLETCENTGLSNFTNNNQLVVGHHQPGSNANGGGWIARFAALLVGEDPTQSYALICGNCHMHNGLSRKEDFPYVTYYCPHCNALNKSQPDAGPNSDSGNISSSATSSIDDPTKSVSGRTSERVSSSNSPTVAAVETMEESETVLPGDSKKVN